MDDDYTCCVDNFQLLCISLINFLNMINNDNNIEDDIIIDVESSNSVFSDTSDTVYNFNLYDNDNCGDCNWKVILETPKIDTLQPLINMKYPDYKGNHS